MTPGPRRFSRRSWLRGTGVAGVVGLAGCMRTVLEGDLEDEEEAVDGGESESGDEESEGREDQDGNEEDESEEEGESAAGEDDDEDGVENDEPEDDEGDEDESEEEDESEDGGDRLSDVTVEDRSVSMEARDGEFVESVTLERTESVTVAGETNQESVHASLAVEGEEPSTARASGDGEFSMTLETVEGSENGELTVDDVDDGELTVAVGPEPETEPAVSRTTTLAFTDDVTDVGGGEVRFFGADRRNTGEYTSAIRIREEPTLAWTFDVDEHITSRPAIVEGTVYFSTDSERLYALDGATGTLEWSFDAGFEREEKHVSGSPTVLDGVVYVAYGHWMHDDDEHDSAGLVTALDAETGEQRWENAEFDDRFSTSPMPSPDGDTLYTGTWSEGPYALDAATGEIRWSYEGDDGGSTGGLDRTVPAVTDDGVFVAGSGISRLEPETGELVWNVNVGTARSSPAVVDGTVYAGTTDDGGVLYAVDADTGETAWTYETDGWMTCSPSVADGTVYVGTRDNRLHAVDADTGTPEWTFEVSPPDETDWITGKPAVVEDTVYVSPWDGAVHGLDAETGEQLWTFDAGGSARAGPVATVDAVYAGAGDELYALVPDRA